LRAEISPKILVKTTADAGMAEACPIDWILAQKLPQLSQDQQNKFIVGYFNAIKRV